MDSNTTIPRPRTAEPVRHVSPGHHQPTGSRSASGRMKRVPASFNTRAGGRENWHRAPIVGCANSGKTCPAQIRTSVRFTDGMDRSREFGGRGVPQNGVRDRSQLRRVCETSRGGCAAQPLTRGHRATANRREPIARQSRDSTAAINADEYGRDLSTSTSADNDEEECNARRHLTRWGA